MGFNHFIEKIPVNIHAQTKTFMTHNIAVFRPEKFVTGQKMSMDNYHFIIFYTTPPLATIDDREYQFKRGSLVALEPKTEITVYVNENTQACEYISIMVNKDFLHKIAFEIFGKSKIEFDPIERSYSMQLLEAIKHFEHELSTYGDKYPIMINSITTQIVILLLRDSHPDAFVGNEIDHQDEDYLVKAIDYMRTYYSSNITIDDISREIFLSPSHFKRVFKMKTGITPYQFLIKLRIDKVKQLLAMEGYSIDEAAMICGFANSGHLATVFRRSEGMTPSEYKKKFQVIDIPKTIQ